LVSSIGSLFACKFVMFFTDANWAPEFISPQSFDEATQHSSSPNLIRKVQFWRDWDYNDGSLKKYKEGQGTGSGVYQPCLNVSYYENPRGVGITNTISHAE